MALDQEVTLVNKYFEKIIDFGFEYVPKLIGGIIVLVLDYGSQN
jgi:small conductance mechanosensitive channel